MGAYHQYLWNKALPTLQSATDEYKACSLIFPQEPMVLACQEHITAQHVIEAASKHMATAVALHRHTWLHSANISNDSCMGTEDLPFDGASLFYDKTDEILDNLQKVRKNSSSL